jgi:hypothetical protein
VECGGKKFPIIFEGILKTNEYGSSSKYSKYFVGIRIWHYGKLLVKNGEMPLFKSQCINSTVKFQLIGSNQIYTGKVCFFLLAFFIEVSLRKFVSFWIIQSLSQYIAIGY